MELRLHLFRGRIADCDVTFLSLDPQMGTTVGAAGGLFLSFFKTFATIFLRILYQAAGGTSPHALRRWSAVQRANCAARPLNKSATLMLSRSQRVNVQCH
jgi:hypothetical protein